MDRFGRVGMVQNVAEDDYRAEAQWILRRMAWACKDAAAKDQLAKAVNEIEKALEAVIRRQPPRVFRLTSTLKFTSFLLTELPRSTQYKVDPMN
jgi:hypothetical protein